MCAQIELSGIATFQGRCEDSTNGCTVIAPLVVSCHLDGRGNVSNDDIVDIIDKKCGPLLEVIRKKSGIEGYDYFVPSDAQDHLIDCMILNQSQFVDVLGGNMLDKQHIGGLL